MKRLAMAGAVAAMFVSQVFAEEVFPIEYVSGHAGMEKKIKGTLMLDDAAVHFRDNEGKEIFAIPMKGITKAVSSTEKSSGSFGRKMALGVFASKDEEFLDIDWRSDKEAEGVVFKTKSKQSPGIAAKVNFYRDKAAPPAPTAK